MNGARKIKASNKLSTRGKHNSSKMFKMIPWESTLERDFIKLLDFDPTVISFQSQPIRIDYLFQGKERKYYPDFLVKKNDYKNYIYEVKALNKTNEERNIVKFQVGRRYCLENNMKYVIVTEKDIRKGYLIENLDLLSEARKELTSKRIMSEIINVLEKIGDNCSIRDLRNILCHITEIEFKCNLFYLIYTHHIQTDLISQPINDDLIIERV
ncbi:TnsA endonuclease N-terminal domain-containing protein [Metabacillus litoralis]|uniref:TnsA endonuclease N-terminal domain-containing protein n=1 Tax=Metabacillus litoralis TaxID=152268 RepID=UPI00203CDA8A|nr:TnsA endonuclease N-terminal domain-containing protein [Metabacillus litoralis]MCM3410213.1 TnsA endonuclease N-terminal domain-containing protein [Metabacillus litoralis]